MGKLIRKFWWVIFLVPLLLVGAFVVWASTPLGPMPEALAALQSDAQVQVRAGDLLVFQPTGQTPTTGVIFYPGGRVDYRSYAPDARAMAAQGYLVVIPKMPLNMAFFDSSRADDVMQAFPEVKRWAVGGHSLGGAMAAHYAAVRLSAHRADANTAAQPLIPDPLAGLFLWAAYPAEKDDLSSYPLSVVVVYGTRDGVATPEEVLGGKPLLPAAAEWAPVEGGNHAQFGWYGDQPGDNPAQISRQQQTDQAVQATLEMLKKLNP
jgi:hypothetical protein